MKNIILVIALVVVLVYIYYSTSSVAPVKTAMPRGKSDPPLTQGTLVHIDTSQSSAYMANAFDAIAAHKK